MKLPIPLFLVRASGVFGDWANVSVAHIEIRRIDLLTTAGFLICTSWYAYLYGILGAVQGGVMFIVIAALALFVRRPDTTS